MASSGRAARRRRRATSAKCERRDGGTAQERQTAELVVEIEARLQSVGISVCEGATERGLSQIRACRAALAVLERVVTGER